MKDTVIKELKNQAAIGGVGLMGGIVSMFPSMMFFNSSKSYSTALKTCLQQGTAPSAETIANALTTLAGPDCPYEAWKACCDYAVSTSNHEAVQAFFSYMEHVALPTTAIIALIGETGYLSCKLYEKYQSWKAGPSSTPNPPDIEMQNIGTEDPDAPLNPSYTPIA